MICFRIFWLMLAVFMWGGCTVLSPTRSDFSQGVSLADAKILVADAVEYLIDPLPPAHTTLVLDIPDSEKQSYLTQALLDSLRERGYGVRLREKKTGSVISQETPLRYTASPIESGLLFRIQYQGREASRFYPRTAEGKLLANESPFTVRRGGDE